MPSRLRDDAAAAVGEPDEHVIPSRDAVTIVDVLQVVDVEEQQREGIAAALSDLRLLRELLEERGARQRQRQRVEGWRVGGFCKQRFGHRTVDLITGQRLAACRVDAKAGVNPLAESERAAFT